MGMWKVRYPANKQPWNKLRFSVAYLGNHCCHILVVVVEVAVVPVEVVVLGLTGRHDAPFSVNTQNGLVYNL